MAIIFERKEGKLNYQEGSQVRFELSNNSMVRRYIVKLTVDHDNGAAPVFNDSLLWSIISSLRITVGGGTNIKQIPGSKIAINNIFNYGITPKGFVDTAGNTTNSKSYAYGFIDFALPNMARPFDGIFDTRKYKSLDFIVDWGANSAIGSDITINSAVLEISKQGVTEYERNMAGQSANGVAEPIRFYREDSLIREVTSTTNDLQIRMPQDKKYMALILATTNDYQYVDSIIKSIKLESSAYDIIDLSAEEIQAVNIFDSRGNTVADHTGLYRLDFTPRGRITDLISTFGNTKTGFVDFTLSLDVEKSVAGTDRITVYSDYIEEQINK